MLIQSLPTIARRSVWFLAAYCFFVAELSAQPSGITLKIGPDRPTVIAGEPLIITVTLKNSSTDEVKWRTDPEALLRVTVGPDNFKIVPVPPAPIGVSFLFARTVAPDNQDTVIVVAAETARIRLPGDYRITVQYPPLHISGELEFTVRPYDRSALRARAYEVLGPAVDWRSADSAASLGVLEAIEPAVSKPLLCDVLMRNPMADTVPRRLEEIGDIESADCLIGALSAVQGTQHEVVVGALTRLIANTTDKSLREKMKKALEGN